MTLPPVGGIKLRYYLLGFLLAFGLVPLFLAVIINLPLVLERTGLFYQKAYLQNLRADFRDLDQHLASRHEMIRLLAKLPEPGAILGADADSQQVDWARARYTEWINQFIADQPDIVQIVFLGDDGSERFWLIHDLKERRWTPTGEPPKLPSAKMIEAALLLPPGGVMVSRIRIDREAERDDPRTLMTLSIVTTIGDSLTGPPLGGLVMTIDIGGLAQFYHDTLWVNNDGSYLRPGQPPSDQPEAFRDYPGLEEIFAQGNLALLKGPDGRDLLWVPMFLTEQGEPIWVARAVDPSPLENFRNALILRVLTIVLILVAVLMLLARWIAKRAERLGQTLIEGIERTLRRGEEIRFEWRGPVEVRALGRQLTELAHANAAHLESERQHTRELERSNRYKSEFLANMSHELRTPLNSILLLSKMLAEDVSGLSPEQQRQARVIHEAGADLRTLIDNILDLSRIEAQQVSISLESIELKPLLEDLLALTAPQFSAKGLSTKLDLTPGSPTRIYSDRERLRQILKNFLSNAAKFTDRGGVTLRLGAQADGRCPVIISVIDSGIGIPLDKQQVIFEHFKQADGSTRRRFGGTGLGLSISRELAALLGGQIQVQSAPGEGATFSLHLPQTLDPDTIDASGVLVEVLGQEPEISPELSDEESKSAPKPRSELIGRWVLVIERDVRALLHVAGLLEALGLRVQTAADADEAMETLVDEPDCSVVLLAALESVRATCDTIQRIRGGDGGAGLPILVMGHMVAGSEAQLRCERAGATGYLAKPVEPGPLEDRLSEIFQSRS